MSKESEDSPTKTQTKQSATEQKVRDGVEASTVRSLSGSREPVDPRSQASVGSLLDRAYKVLHLFALMNWTGCLRQERRYGSDKELFHRNVMKSTVKGNHWGDARAALEIAVDRLLEAVKTRPPVIHSKKGPRREVTVEEDIVIVRLVRKDLTDALLNLMRHGLVHVSSNTSSSFKLNGPLRKRCVLILSRVNWSFIS